MNQNKIKKIGRIGLKYRKYRYKHSKPYSLILILLYIIRNLINIFLLRINLVLSLSSMLKNHRKRILFIEPPQQGYGDLLFQTPIFSILAKRGYVVTTLMQKKHKAILKNNPNVSNIWFWNFRGIFNIFFSKYDFVVGLGRDTIKTNVILLLKILNKKIIPDSNLKAWHESFNQLNPCQAWQVLVLSKLERFFDFETPRIYLSNEENKKIKTLKNKKTPIILLIMNVDNKLKQYPYWQEVIDKLDQKNMYIALKNANEAKLTESIKRSVRYLSTDSYRKAILTIAASDIVVGVEGSLIHIAAALGKKLIVLEANNSFRKQTFLTELNNSRIISHHVCQPWYHTDLKKTLMICYLDDDGDIKQDYNPCLSSINPLEIIRAINDATDKI